MSNHHLARIEAQLERLIEGTFTQIFRQRISGHELLLHITRALADHLAESTQADDQRPVAPDKFTIYLNPDIIPHIAKDEPHLIALLCEHVSELASSHDYRFQRVPSILLLPNADLSTSEVIVDATHQARPSQETSSLQRIELPPASQPTPIGRLIINGEQTVMLGETVTNVGRSRDNDIVLTEPTVSRHHAQVRLRFGAYTLFDNDSQHGTYVNEIRIREHRLQSGDVILMGNARMIYVEDNEQVDNGQTDIYPPLRS